MKIFHIYNNSAQCTHILCKHKLLFWMRLMIWRP